MFDEMVVRNCAPTLAGIKVGSLFSCIGHSTEYTLEQVRSLNIRLQSYGVRLIPVCSNNKPSLVYMYRPEKLRKYFMEDDVKELLKEYGYEPENLDECVKVLISRLFESDVFPHEIGLFLGYPSEDVRGFIENHACGSKCIGCWKVYGDVDQARKRFDLYNKCTSIYCRRLREGSSIEKLTTAC
ncbi:MAG: DUF3793 family protein [Clostridiales bacterium]|nr:DUF3793 family protein [Clostridiales bacterium]